MSPAADAGEYIERTGSWKRFLALILDNIDAGGYRVQMMREILQEIDEMGYPSQEIGRDLEGGRVTDRYTAAAYGFQEAKDRIVEIIRSHSNDGWIPCSERLPEIGKPVLVCDKQRNVCVRAITCEIKGKKYWSQEKYDVIAWRPLPETYRPQKSVGKDYKQQIMEKFLKVK